MNNDVVEVGISDLYPVTALKIKVLKMKCRNKQNLELI